LAKKNINIQQLVIKLVRITAHSVYVDILYIEFFFFIKVSNGLILSIQWH